MKKRTPVLISAFLAVLVVACTAPSGGRWPREGVMSPAKGNRPAETVIVETLALTIATDRNRYLFGEPVYLSLQVRNISGKSQRAISSLDPSDRAVEIFITGPDGAKRTFRPLAEVDDDGHLNVELPPGGVIGGVTPIFFGAGGWTFARTGRYAVMAVYNVPFDGRITQTVSRPLAIDIEPSPAGERLMGKDDEVRVEVGKFLTWQAGDHLIRGQERMQDLLNTAPESPLASYIRAAFARSQSEPFMHYGRREVRPANCGRALTHLGRVDLKRMPQYIQVQSALVGARCRLLAKNWDAAARHVAQARRIVDGQPEFRSFTERLDRLEAYMKSAR